MTSRRTSSYTSMEEETASDVGVTKEMKNNAYLDNDGHSHVTDATARDVDVSVKDEEKEDLRCGLGTCKPDWLQQFNNPKVVLIWLSWFAFIQGFVVNGINNVNTSSLERRFELSSKEVSLISSSYDVSAAILVLPITYFGAFAHQPRMLTVAAFFMALGSFVMALPHFTSDLYELKESKGDQCLINDNSTVTIEQCEKSTLPLYLGVLIFGQILHGVGGTTIYSIGVVYIDSNVLTKNSPLYQGIMYAFSALGPAVGYLLGGYMVNTLYVDFDVFDQDRLDITSNDPRWVGSWWLGCLAAGCLGVTISLLLMCYGRETPIAQRVRDERVSQTHADGSEAIASREDFGTTWKDIPVAVKLLLKNPVYMLINIAGASESIATSGMATFIPKLVQNQFGVSAGYAAILAGAIAVPGAAGGQFAGGLICRLANLKVKGMLGLNVGMTVAAIVSTVVLLARCTEEPLAGVNITYNNGTLENEDINLVNACNLPCNCSTLSYEPICGDNGLQYFSPCHAGCQSKMPNDSSIYTDCACIGAEYGSRATAGKCTTDCSLLYAFLPVMFLVIFFTFCAAVPAVSVTLRCVSERQRSFAVGVQWVILRLLGSIPGPILFGAIFDTTCVVWQNKCGETGSCWVYDTKDLSERMLYLVIAIKVTSLIFFTLSFLVYKAPQNTGDKAQDTNSQDLAYALESFDQNGKSNSVSPVNGFITTPLEEGHANPGFTPDHETTNNDSQT